MIAHDLLLLLAVAALTLALGKRLRHDHRRRKAYRQLGKIRGE
jgi:hypothetical protein